VSCVQLPDRKFPDMALKVCLKIAYTNLIGILAAKKTKGNYSR
jgi:hypothetical protein